MEIKLNYKADFKQLVIKRENIYIRKTKKNMWSVIGVDTTKNQTIILNRNIWHYDEAKRYFKDITRYPTYGLFIEMNWASKFIPGGEFWIEDFG